MGLEALSIHEARPRLVGGSISVAALVEDCLTRIHEFEPTIQAWARYDPKHIRRQAEALDEARRHGKPIGRLHGIPVGIQDLIDTRLIPTEYGMACFQGHLPAADAGLITRLRQQGAVIMGKTATTPLATSMPGKTTNPHRSGHTPGGAACGSAAAVAAYMATAAVGVQTAGDVICPAAFCGIVGYKPSFGLIARTGVLPGAPFLDQVGVFARQVADAALLGEVLCGYDPGDSATTAAVMPPLAEICLTEPPVEVKFAVVDTASMPLDADTSGGLAELVDALGGRAVNIALPADFAAAEQSLQIIRDAETAAGAAYTKGRPFLSPSVVARLERGLHLTAGDYLQALQQRAHLNTLLDTIFDEYDALIMPAAPGTAPTMDTIGNHVCCTPWTLCGLPTITLPLLHGANDLPIGVQLVGRYLDDGRLLRSARWLHNFVLRETAA